MWLSCFYLLLPVLLLKKLKLKLTVIFLNQPSLCWSLFPCFCVFFSSFLYANDCKFSIVSTPLKKLHLIWVEVSCVRMQSRVMNQSMFCYNSASNMSDVSMYWKWHWGHRALGGRGEHNGEYTPEWEWRTGWRDKDGGSETAADEGWKATVECVCSATLCVFHELILEGKHVLKSLMYFVTWTIPRRFVQEASRSLWVTDGRSALMCAFNIKFV